MMSEQTQQICQALNDVDNESKAIEIVKNIFEEEICNTNFIYRGYFFYDNEHTKKWIEFDARCIIHPDIWFRSSIVSYNTDPDVQLCRKLTDKILEDIQFLYKNRKQTRIIIEFNDGFSNAELKMTISE